MRSKSFRAGILGGAIGFLTVIAADSPPEVDAHGAFRLDVLSLAPAVIHAPAGISRPSIRRRRSGRARPSPPCTRVSVPGETCQLAWTLRSEKSGVLHGRWKFSGGGKTVRHRSLSVDVPLQYAGKFQLIGTDGKRTAIVPFKNLWKQTGRDNFRYPGGIAGYHITRK